MTMGKHTFLGTSTRWEDVPNVVGTPFVFDAQWRLNHAGASHHYRTQHTKPPPSDNDGHNASSTLSVAALIGRPILQTDPFYRMEHMMAFLGLKGRKSSRTSVSQAAKTLQPEAKTRLQQRLKEADRHGGGNENLLAFFCRGVVEWLGDAATDSVY